MIARIRISRWGGAAFMLGSLLFFINKLNEMSRLFFGRPMPDVISGQDEFMVILGQVALIVGFSAFFWFYSRLVGRFGKITLGMFCGGGIMLAIGHASFITVYESTFIFVLFGVAVSLIGLILFGIGNLRHPVFGRWQWLPLATGLFGVVGFFMFGGEEITAVFLSLRTLFALGLFGLGGVLWFEKADR